MSRNVAIAVWDNKEDILYLIRDRFGEKPLYYGFQKNNSENVFLFGSRNFPKEAS